jgi:serine/threonine-protein kinase
MESDLMRHAPGSRVDRYEVVEALGEGAYAETYLARDTSTGQLVVLKAANPNLFADPGLFQRYRRESEIARTIDHPGVQRAVDAGDHRTEPYLVLEYVDGENLRRRLSDFAPQHGQVPIPLVIDWARQLANTLAYLHGRGIVHRDLKPENILMTPEDQLKVADFGTALLDGAKRLTWRHLSESLGTPDYMSPEQIQGGRGDQRSDIYSWGVIVYELLTGTVPFSGDNWMATMAGHLTKDPEPIQRQRPDVSPGLEAVVLKAMRRYPEHRYQSADELVGDLDRLDTLEVASFDLSPEAPMGGLAAIESRTRLTALVVLIAVAVVAIGLLIYLLVEVVG